MNNKLKIMWKTMQFKACCRSLHGNVETSGADLRKLFNIYVYKFSFQAYIFVNNLKQIKLIYFRKLQPSRFEQAVNNLKPIRKILHSNADRRTLKSVQYFSQFSSVLVPEFQYVHYIVQKFQSHVIAISSHQALKHNCSGFDFFK